MNKQDLVRAAREGFKGPFVLLAQLVASIVSVFSAFVRSSPSDESKAAHR